MSPRSPEFQCAPVAIQAASESVPEDLDQARQLDLLLGDLWQGYPNYLKLLGTADIEDKLAAAMSLMIGL